MLTFLLALVLIFAVVDLFVMLVIEPLASKDRARKTAKLSYRKNIIPTIDLVGATMYDGGIKKEEKKKDTDEKKSS